MSTNGTTAIAPVPVPGGTPVRQSLLEGYQTTVQPGTYRTQHIAVKPDYWFITLVSAAGSILVNPSASPGTPAFPLAAGGYLKLPALGREITFINSSGAALTISFWAVINYDLAFYPPASAGGGTGSDVTIVGPLNGSGYVETAVESLPAVTLASGQTVDVGNFPASQPVTGTVNVGNLPATQDVSFNGTAQPVSITGTPTVDVGNFPGSQPVSGTITAVGDAASGSPVTGNPVLVGGSDGTDARSLHTDTAGNLGVNVQNLPATQPVSGTVSVGNLPATQPVSGSVSVANFPATQPVSGSVNVGNFPATQPVSGTVGIGGAPIVTAEGGAAAGSAPSGNPVLVAGSDGTDVRTLLTTSGGNLLTEVQSATNLLAVTPTDGTQLPGGTTRAVWVGSAGNIALRLSGMSAPVTLTGVNAGTLLPVAASYVYNTGTTAGSIVAVY